MMNKLSIYVHVPFCESKCAYCAFASFVRPEEQARYFSALYDEIESKGDKTREVDTIYIGGGTPSVVEPEFIEKTLKTIEKCFNLSKNCEVSIECNPNSVSEDKLKRYLAAGVNRISFGVQSLKNKTLKRIGRRHTKNDAKRAIKLARREGFKNINADLLIGLPYKTKPAKHAKKLIKKGATHISAYMLQVEPNTRLKWQIESGEVKLPSDEDCVEAYQKLVRKLAKKGFVRYEISNFALPGYECRHNLKYWSRGEYLGFGLSAHSFVGGIRSANASNFEDYYVGKVASEKISRTESIEEIIMLGLRCTLGVSINELKKLGYDIAENQYFKLYLHDKILTQIGDQIYLNQDFYGVSNTIISNLLP